MPNKILLNYDEYRRLKNIEQEYLKLRRQKNSPKKSPAPESDTETSKSDIESSPKRETSFRSVYTCCFI